MFALRVVEGGRWLALGWSRARPAPGPCATGFGIGSGAPRVPIRYAGLFNTKREAKARQAWVLGQLAAMRVPDMDLLADESRAPTLREAAERWLASRIDVAENTKGNSAPPSRDRPADR